MECETEKSEVLSEFTRDTEAMLKKLPNIKECGQKYNSPFQTNAFIDCISSLGLPYSYENEISSFLSFAFQNDNSFKKAMQKAASNVCFDLNFVHIKKKRRH